MKWLISDFALFTVLLRALVFSCEALLVGGICFRLFVLRTHGEHTTAEGSWRHLVRGAALGLFSAELAYIIVNAVVLKGSTSLDWKTIAGAAFVWSSAAGALTALVAWFALRFAARMPVVLAALGIIVIAAIVATSHAASELDDAPILLAATALHHLGTALWIGAMPYMLLSLPRIHDSAEAREFALRYSRMALVGVPLLVLGGIIMSKFYVASWPGLYGTAYGLMLLAKITLFFFLLAMGAGNFYLLRQDGDPRPLLRRLASFTEVEVGVGFTVLLAAASLTSQPPARDLIADRLTGHELVAGITPHAPRLSSPSLSALSPASDFNSGPDRIISGAPTTQNNHGDIAWSEYKHHWAGVIDLAAGALALLSRSRLRWTRWARHWPLAFIALAVFILLRADPESWPLGPNSFWASFYNSEILQHRIAALLVIAFAWFEWRVQTGHITHKWMRLVFPGICAAGAALLLTHNHALSNVKEELLAEYNHTSIAVAGVVAGWSRWLELRLPADSARNRRTIHWAGIFWPVCLMVAGAILLNYREA